MTTEAPLSTRSTYTLRLKGEPDGARFAFRFLSGREQIALAEKLDADDQALRGGDEKPPGWVTRHIVAAFESLRLAGLRGWEGVIDRATDLPRPFADEAIEDVLSWQQAEELAYAALAWRPPAELAKNSARPSPSGAAACANDAPGRLATADDAPSGPTPTSPSN